MVHTRSPVNILTSTFNLTHKRPDAFSYRSYQSFIYCSPNSTIQSPSSEVELLSIVNRAIIKGQKIKPIGSRHSITDIICTDGVPISMKNFKHARIENDTIATFGAGIELQDALIFLEKRNKTLIHVPAYGGITLGGAIGTGAHGSSLLHPTTISDQITSVKIIDGNGVLKTIAEPTELSAFRVNLGLLGIVLEVSLKIVPLFYMNVATTLEKESILMDGTALGWARAFDFFQMWWFPSTSKVVVLKGLHSPMSIGGNASTQFIPSVEPVLLSGGHVAYETVQATRDLLTLYRLEELTERSLYSEVVGKPPIFSEDGITLKNPAHGIAWRLQTNKCSTCAWENGVFSILPEESSIALALEQLPAAIALIKEVLTATPAAFPLTGIFIRFSTSSSSHLGISSGRDTVTLEWTTPMRNDPFQDPKLGIAAYQGILQGLVEKLNGRPHWGKNGLHYLTSKVLRKVVPNLEKFGLAMKENDPNGIYLNKFGLRLLGISEAMDQDPKVVHCALQDYCVCRKDSDCGALIQSCEKFNGFSVCRDLLDQFLDQMNLSLPTILEPWTNSRKLRPRKST